MASLKEVKSRILSVESTKKITVARQMISSARLRYSQGILETVILYQKELEAITAKLIDPQNPLNHKIVNNREKGRIALVVMSSNSGMCGSFNAKMIKEVNNLSSQYPNDQIVFIPVGKKIREALSRMGYPIVTNDDELAGKFSLSASAGFVDQLINLFCTQDIKKVLVVYYHYKSAATQLITTEQLLPVLLPEPNPITFENEADLYIFEPSREAILADMLSLVIKSRFYVALADQHTSEHGARTLAMQLASENANDLLEELRLSYNKLRQQNITSELLDIIGGSFA
ncbi:MAG: ATP synthase F1 subunit gamma [Prevotellaceae bacterium]|jgi:F-type H+-transporting ATPase subunit gamma|nr:ATP synthase F1 subunit gamma [Prevotellaceae bacterium]